MKALYYVDVTTTHAVVGDSPEHAVQVARDMDPDALYVRRSAALATAALPCLDAVALAMLPEWEYPSFDDMAPDAEERRDPDFVRENAHLRRAWTIRRWVQEQAEEASRTAPAIDIAPVVALVPVNADWRSQPTTAEGQAHHVAHADWRGVSRWHMESTAGDACVIVTNGGDLAFLAHEGTRWRPCDALLTPVAWPTGSAR